MVWPKKLMKGALLLIAVMLVSYYAKRLAKFPRRWLAYRRKGVIRRPKERTQVSHVRKVNFLASIRGKRITIVLNQCVLKMGREVEIVEGAKEALMDLCHHGDVYAIVRIERESQEEEVKKLLMRHGIVYESGLHPYKLLFCTTTKGTQAMVRHIEPYLHIDVDTISISILKSHVSHLVHIVKGIGMTQSQSNIMISETLGSALFL